MNVALFLAANAVSIICLLAAIALAWKDRFGWPAFLFAAVVTAISTTSVKNLIEPAPQQQEATAATNAKPAG